MDLHPTPFPVKSVYMKPKSTRRIIPESSKNTKKVGPPIVSENRVFGIARNPNIPLKTAPSNTVKAKLSSDPLKKAQKPSQQIRPAVPEARSSSGKMKDPARPKTKNVCFQEKKEGKDGFFLSVEPRTPAKSHALLAKPRLSITPYHSAEKCSKCRFDRLETSSYWLCQIKLAETVGKHTVSAAFFRLAFDCGAEPIRNIRVELKKYVARHECLNVEEEWKKLFICYGLMKEEITSGGDEENPSVDSREDEDLLNEIAQEIKNFIVS